MRLRKVAFGDREVQKKYRVSCNSNTSYWREEFDCDGNVVHVQYKRDKPKKNFGTSKLEDKVSVGYYVNPLRGMVGHG
jgi:hypothetical protein